MAPSAPTQQTSHTGMWEEGGGGGPTTALSSTSPGDTAEL